MILSIHQPNFLPWVGFFSKVKKSDIFIVLDSVQYPRGKSYANRAKIKDQGRELELVVPVSKKKGMNGIISYRGVEFAEENWNRKIINSIKYAYGKAPFYNKYAYSIFSILQNNNFCEMNISLLKFIAKELELSTQIALLSELIGMREDKNERIVDLCHFFNANSYLSGQGGESYNDSSMFKENDINLYYHFYQPKEYKQMGNKFIPNLSIIDLVFNCGPLSNEYL